MVMSVIVMMMMVMMCWDIDVEIVEIMKKRMMARMTGF